MLAPLLAAAALTSFGGIAWSSDGSRLAFAATAAATGHTDVYTVRPDGTDLRNVTADDLRPMLYSPNLPAHAEPAWSRDGRLAYVVGRGDFVRPAFEYWIANGDGSGKRLVTTQPTDQTPSWSPDGTKLTMESFEAIVAARVDTGAVNTVAAGAGSSVWSPRDRRIALLRMGPRDNGDVYTVRGDGTHARRLTTARGSDWPIAWSPDAKRIAFRSQRGEFAKRGRADDLALYVMDSDGRHQRRVAPAQPGSLGEGSASFGPRGGSLVYAYRGSLYVVGVDGRGTRTIAAGTDPQWSPDGRWIAFVGARGVELVRPNGSGEHTIVD